MTLNAKIGGFINFSPISGCDTSLYHLQGGVTVLSLCAHRHDCNKDVVFYPKFPQIQLKQTDFRCTISLYCQRNNLLFSAFLTHSIWWSGLHILQRYLWHFVRWCCHFWNWFQLSARLLAIAILSLRPSNCQILIIFSMNTPATTCHQLTIQFPTSLNLCFCTTWGKHNKQNITFLSDAIWLLN